MVVKLILWFAILFFPYLTTPLAKKMVARVLILQHPLQPPPPRHLIRRASRLLRPLRPQVALVEGERRMLNTSLSSPTQALKEAALHLQTLPHKEDLNLFFTPPFPSLGLGGMALTLGTVCTPFGTNVALIALPTPSVVAHEVGHLLGLQHDTTTPPWGGGCGRGLMGGLPRGWSNCSQVWWQRRVAGKWGVECLVD